MTAHLCHTPTPCPMLLAKNSTNCGHKVLYGPTDCWRRDGRPERKVGLENETSPYSGGSDDDDTCD